MFNIYIVKNDINNKVYVGRTSYTIEHRFRNHTYASKRTRNTTPLAVAMRTFGLQHFWVELLEQHEDQAFAREREMYWVNHYDALKSGYNANQGGSGGESRIPEDKRQEVVELYVRIQNASQVSEYLGNVSPMTVFRILEEANIKTIKRYDRNKKQVRIIELDKTFESIRDCARWLIEEGYVNGNVKTTEGGILKQLGGRRHQYVGFHFERL